MFMYNMMEIGQNFDENILTFEQVTVAAFFV